MNNLILFTVQPNSVLLIHSFPCKSYFSCAFSVYFPPTLTLLDFIFSVSCKFWKTVSQLSHFPGVLCAYPGLVHGIILLFPLLFFWIGLPISLDPMACFLLLLPDTFYWSTNSSHIVRNFVLEVNGLGFQNGFILPLQWRDSLTEYKI